MRRLILLILVALSGCTPFVGAGVGKHFHQTNTYGEYPAMLEAGVEFKPFPVLGWQCTPDASVMHVSHLDTGPPDTTAESVFISARCRP